MEDQETSHPDYVKGFNEGYVISKHLPDLAGKMPNDLPGERGLGFQHGRKEFLSEKDKERRPAWLKSDRLSNLNKPSLPSKDKDGPDR